MKELDLQNATLLKKFLSVKYYGYEIKACQDICTLTRMCLVTMLGWVACVIGVGIITIVACALLSPIVLITLYLPEGWQVGLDIMGFGAMTLFFYIVSGVLGIAWGLGAVLLGNWQFAPEYMKRPLRKLFKKKSSSDTSPKEKVPSQTWIVVKEMYKSVKEKTCIKVKL